jgi:hypothetical protein
VLFSLEANAYFFLEKVLVKLWKRSLARSEPVSSAQTPSVWRLINLASRASAKQDFLDRIDIYFTCAQGTLLMERCLFPVPFQTHVTCVCWASALVSKKTCTLHNLCVIPPLNQRNFCTQAPKIVNNQVAAMRDASSWETRRFQVEGWDSMPHWLALCNFYRCKEDASRLSKQFCHLSLFNWQLKNLGPRRLAGCVLLVGG